MASDRKTDRKVKQQKFLDAYSKGTSLSASARIAGVDRTTVYNWKEEEDFARRFADAYEDGNDRIDDAILTRAVDGYLVPMLSMGKVVYGDDAQPMMETRYSDSLATLLAKSRMPKYREKQQLELTGTNGGPVQFQHLSNLTEQELDTLEQLARQAQERESASGR